MVSLERCGVGRSPRHGESVPRWLRLRDRDAPGDTEAVGEHAEAGAPGGRGERFDDHGVDDEVVPVALKFLEAVRADRDEQCLLGHGGVVLTPGGASADEASSCGAGNVVSHDAEAVLGSDEPEYDLVGSG